MICMLAVDLTDLVCSGVRMRRMIRVRMMTARPQSPETPWSPSSTMVRKLMNQSHMFPPWPSPVRERDHTRHYGRDGTSRFCAAQARRPLPGRSALWPGGHTRNMSAYKCSGPPSGERFSSDRRPRPQVRLWQPPTAGGFGPRQMPALASIFCRAAATSSGELSWVPAVEKRITS